MNGVCLHLVPPDGTKGPYLGDCTEEEGAFEIKKIPPGSYVIIVNDDNEVTSNHPFGAFYYPNVTKREEATVFHIGRGEFIENLEIFPTISAETITAEGVFLYSDGKPVVNEFVSFRSAKAKGDEDDDHPENAGTKTDSQGRFSIKILKGTRGVLTGWMFTFEGEFENCKQLDRLIKQSGEDAPEIKTAPLTISAQDNIYGVVLKFPFPGCKKAKIGR
jgi:hypothetical protein